MRIILSIILSALLLGGYALAEEQQGTKKEAMSQKEKMSYSLGYKTGINTKKISGDVDLDIFIKAFREGFAGNKATMTDQEMSEVMRPLAEAMKAKENEKKKAVAAKTKELAEKNKKEGETFLAENAIKEGVVTLASGLQYKVIKEGTGKSPAKTDKVKVHYRGSFINGTEFDSSYKRGKPATFAVDKVIKGWIEALQLMKEGSKWMLYVAPNLAYGEQGARGKIGPNQTLIFEVELITVQSQKPKDGI